MTAAFDEDLIWYDPEDTQTSLIETRCSLEPADESLWPEYLEWLRVRLETFQAVLWPIVGRVPPPQDAGHGWDAESFFAALTSLNPEGVAPARELLLARAAAAGFRSTWGRGRRYGSVAARVVYNGQPYEPVSI